MTTTNAQSEGIDWPGWAMCLLLTLAGVLCLYYLPPASSCGCGSCGCGSGGCGSGGCACEPDACECRKTARPCKMNCSCVLNGDRK